MFPLRIPPEKLASIIGDYPFYSQVADKTDPGIPADRAADRSYLPELCDRVTAVQNILKYGWMPRKHNGDTA